MQVMVLAVVAAGVALGIYLWTVFAPVKHALLLAHMIIGLIIFAFLVVQASAALFVRPQPKSRYRRAGGISISVKHPFYAVHALITCSLQHASSRCMCCSPAQAVDHEVLLLDDACQLCACAGVHGTGCITQWATPSSSWRWPMHSLACTWAKLGAGPSTHS
jgi:hypothetical protein